VRTWLGVPYAAPPVGPLRFLPPRPPAPGPGVRECTARGPACPQPGPGPASGAANLTTSEDCLTLDIHSPGAGGEGGLRLLPVLVWLHGGAFRRGGAGLGPGAGLAARGRMVVVAAQYRLGALGFLGLGPESANLGLQDQALALAWVRANIRLFGGDPDRITLGGQEVTGWAAPHTALCSEACHAAETLGSAGLGRRSFRLGLERVWRDSAGRPRSICT
jgi:para-nitrobenzyl esterase